MDVLALVQILIRIREQQANSLMVGYLAEDRIVNFNAISTFNKFNSLSPNNYGMEFFYILLNLPFYISALLLLQNKRDEYCEVGRNSIFIRYHIDNYFVYSLYMYVMNYFLKINFG